jgi:hypothetical protein
MRRGRKAGLMAAVAAGVFIVSAVPGEAQRAVPRRAAVRSQVIVSAGFYRAPYYSPFFWGGWYSPSWGAAWARYPVGYYGPWYVAPRDRAAIHLQVKPREAQVFVDGYYAGIVDDFDGRLQRLRVRAGDRDLTIYLEGYRTIRETVRIRPGEDLRIQRHLEALPAGETSEPPPPPVREAADDPRDEYRPGGKEPGQGRPAPPPDRPGLRPPPAPPRAPWPGQEAGPPAAAGFGALAIRVQPAGAVVLIDGERWQGPDDRDRLHVQLSEGRHRVEVRKEGFVTYSTEIEIRQGETTPLNISLPRRDPD